MTRKNCLIQFCHSIIDNLSHFTDINNKLCLYSSKNWKKILLATIEENLNFIVQVVHLMKTWKEEIGEKRVTPAERYHAMEDSYNNGGNEHDSKIQQIRLWEINMNNNYGKIQVYCENCNAMCLWILCYVYPFMEYFINSKYISRRYDS